MGTSLAWFGPIGSFSAVEPANERSPRFSACAPPPACLSPMGARCGARAQGRAGGEGKWRCRRGCGRRALSCVSVTLTMPGSRASWRAPSSGSTWRTSCESSSGRRGFLLPGGGSETGAGRGSRRGCWCAVRWGRRSAAGAGRAFAEERLWGRPRCGPGVPGAGQPPSADGGCCDARVRSEPAGGRGCVAPLFREGRACACGGLPFSLGAWSLPRPCFAPGRAGRTGCALVARSSCPGRCLHPFSRPVRRLRSRGGKSAEQVRWQWGLGLRSLGIKRP